MVGLWAAMCLRKLYLFFFIDLSHWIRVHCRPQDNRCLWTCDDIHRDSWTISCTVSPFDWFSDSVQLIFRLLANETLFWWFSFVFLNESENKIFFIVIVILIAINVVVFESCGAMFDVDFDDKTDIQALIAFAKHNILHNHFFIVKYARETLMRCFWMWTTKSTNCSYSREQWMQRNVYVFLLTWKIALNFIRAHFIDA